MKLRIFLSLIGLFLFRNSYADFSLYLFHDKLGEDTFIASSSSRLDSVIRQSRTEGYEVIRCSQSGWAAGVYPYDGTGAPVGAACGFKSRQAAVRAATEEYRKKGGYGKVTSWSGYDDDTIDRPSGDRYYHDKFLLKSNDLMN